MSYSIKSTNGYTRRKMLIAGIVVLLLAVGSVLLGANYFYKQNLQPISNSDTSQIIEVATGDTAQVVANKLEEAELIRASWAFAWYMRSEGLRGQIQTGTYAISPNQSVQEIAAVITGGDMEMEMITIPPERRLDQIRGYLINAGFSPEEADEALDPSRHEGHPALADKPAEASLEGYLYPETFRVDANTSAHDIIEASLDEMAARLTQEIREGIAAQGLTVHEGIILASIVEREVTTHNPNDRPQVAQVFYRRIAEGMRLESDITAVYGEALNELNPADNTDYVAQYSTYQNDGLPPTPISNVTESGLRAVAQPADTDYLYFVSGDPDEDGVSITHFSHTLDEHRRLTEEHCTIQCP